MIHTNTDTNNKLKDGKIVKQIFVKVQKQPPEVFFKKTVLTNLAKVTRKHLCQNLIFNKVAGLRLATLLEKRLWNRCFPVNFATFLRTPFLENTSLRLLLKVKFFPSFFTFFLEFWKLSVKLKVWIYEV